MQAKGKENQAWPIRLKARRNGSLMAAHLYKGAITAVMVVPTLAPI